MLPQEDFKELVMRRVRLVFVIRSLIVPTVLELFFVGMFFASVLGFVSVADVIANFKQTAGVGGVLAFAYEAVLHADILVKLGMLFTLVVSGYFAYRIVRTIRVASFDTEVTQGSAV